MATDWSGFRLTRCAIYTRQSVVRRGQDVALSSCQLQRDLCIEFTRSRGWYPIAERFDDEGYGDATVARPALERLLDRVEAGEVQRVIVNRVDRLTRKLPDWARLVAVFDRLGVGLTVVSGVLDIEGGSMARFQLNMLATMAELELDMIGERLADARAARKAQGRRSAGRISFGYVADKGTKQLVVQPEQAGSVHSARIVLLRASQNAEYGTVSLPTGQEERAKTRPDRAQSEPRSLSGVLCGDARSVSPLSPRARSPRVLRPQTTKPPKTFLRGPLSTTGSLQFVLSYEWLRKSRRLQTLFVREFADSQTRFALSTQQRTAATSRA